MSQFVGKPIDRVDGRLKVTGGARYSAEFPLPNIAHAVAFQSTIAKGRVKTMDTREAERAPGVLAVITHKNAPKLQQFPKDAQVGRSGQSFLVLQNDVVHYAGQYLGVVVANTLDQAEHAASLVKIAYIEEKPTVNLEEVMSRRFTPKLIPVIDTPPVDSSRGDVASALAAAPVKLELTYTTPTENHNPMELSATTAAWSGDLVKPDLGYRPDRLTVWDSTQWVMGVRAVLSTQLGIPQEKVRVISHFVGGAFGAKGSTWPHTTLAAIAARQVGRPVKLVVTRHQMFSSTGHRPQTIQQLSLGASRDGKLIALVHDSTSHTSPFDEYVEAAAIATRMLYACPNVKTMHRIARINVNSPSVMRGPGEASGTFALESAIDELAYAVNLDPMDLRLRNYAQTDLHENKPFSSKALRECYRQGAERFDWSRRNPQPRSMRDRDGALVGLGMATAVYPTKRSPSSARVRLYPDGTAIAASATHELGTGAYTAMAQVAADALGMSLDNVRFELGDSTLPNAPIAGGSQSAASVGSAVQAAASDARRKTIALAVADPSSLLYSQKLEAIATEGGRMFVKTDPDRGETYAGVLQRNGYTQNKPLEGYADSAPGEEKKKFSTWAFGAQFCEVRVDPDLGQIRIARWVGAFCAGKILNAKTALSQVSGSIVWGIGMALQEHTVRDPRWGKIVNDNIAEYHVPVNADVPDIDAFFVEENDPHVNPIGAKGVGELGITGTAAAIANAIYHATGKRIRDLPITLDKLL